MGEVMMANRTMLGEMSVLDELIAPDGDAVSHCGRCKCSVPLEEWEMTRGIIGFFRHKGPLRDGHIDKFAVADDSPEYDDENDQCGWMKRIPRKV